ncbi:hemoprotein hemQ, essential component of heme biosynthetic pathway in Gram-positive bacteria [Halarchaeum acidiphilum MH1-52-1]|uniref:Hemoprotein hemQ, essential component of heme biosynthetic pathway in Gram-positive bacteria n=1 Tax=Halarchaeum acidiphilum MH1-52-1 TaxID=1261545 RepID=U2YUS0_9EURY|nr:heme-binding protein [Halarchaeum acidiphilum]GAD52765.1 hemoprotein hemQ, essential component of heme biosynthetic pathway in Gram-positive bacteria [Halarchaeum acidiphilum MH1-52-1]
MVDAPETAEGWFSLHDFRTIDWDAWRDAPERERERALEEAEAFLADREALADATEGDSAAFSMLGHEADLLFVHFRPELDDLDAIERSFESTAFAEYTERSYSYVSVTEVSGYVSDEYFEDPERVDAGVRRYIEGKLTPDVPDDTYVCFYPMSKRRGPEHNWYDLDYEERAELMSGHGDVGRDYAGKIRQVIASSVGLDDWEWGVTLFGSDPVDLKDIVYEMRFDEATSKYGEFGSFYVGRRFPPSDLPAVMAGDRVPTSEHGDGDRGRGENGRHSEGGHHEHEEGHHGDDHGDTEEEGDIRDELEDLDVYAGQPHGEDVYAVVVYSEADVDGLTDEVEDLAESFDHYDTHVRTSVYEGDAEHAVVSLWDTQSAADTAAGFLTDLPEVTRKAGERDDGWGTMGMFYTVKPEYREEFVDTFGEVGDLLADMEGHLETDLLANVDDENDMFIASQWESKEDAMDFFRSEAFSDTVSWGRDVLADRPRHVFLA